MYQLNYFNSISVNYTLLTTPAECQFTIPNREVCSAGFIVYYKF
jgi:hypothetical protein